MTTTNNRATADDILESIRIASQQAPINPFQEAFIEKKKEFAIDGSVDYPDPEYLVEIGGTPTMPKGNLVALSAKWKNGKTFFCDVLTAIFLGSTAFTNCRSLQACGKVQFFDTEQAVSDTARILKVIKAMTGEDRHQDIEVYCLRNADIETEEESDEISRFDFICKSIEHDRPDLVVIDGIADLIYNYNDVIESQSIVNRLAATANEFNCCIIVVMHQNKGQKDRNMKGHLGTMLFQKCSDVFNVEKCGSVFVVSHAVSRHRNCEDICFKLDDNAIPVDAVADRQLQIETERQQCESNLREMLADLIPGDGTPVRRKDVVAGLSKNFGFKKVKCYMMIKNAIKQGWLVETDRLRVRLKS